MTVSDGFSVIVDIPTEHYDDDEPDEIGAPWD